MPDDFVMPERIPCDCGRDHSNSRGCPHRMRHWFTIYGAVGLRKPHCECGAPNPNWTPEMQAEWDAYEEFERARA